MAVATDRIQKLEARLKELKAREVRAAARKRVLQGHRERKDDTRRKILVGAVVLAKVEQGVIGEAELRTWLQGALTRPRDRALFGL
jgi:hypothetical protein